jgi:RNA polymerase sigma-70 factor, ECF subfamily
LTASNQLGGLIHSAASLKALAVIAIFRDPHSDVRISKVPELDGEQVMDSVCRPTGQIRRQDQDRSACGDQADKALISEVASGNDGAMRKLYERHKARVFRFIVRITGDAHLAEDILSEVFLEVWRQAGRFENRCQVSTWILAIARFKAWSAGRQVRQDIDLDEFEVLSIADTAEGPEVAVLKQDRAAQLRRCLAQLSPEHREIIDLVYYHDKTIAEIVDIIHVPRNTVKTRMFYARKRLEGLLKRHANFAAPSDWHAA